MKKTKKRGVRKIAVIIVAIIIISLVSVFTSKEAIEIIETQSNSSETSEVSETTVTESATYYYVESSDGVQVPVPVGYTASEIEGETGVSTGFVIYEGDIDWSEIIVDSDTSSASLEADDVESSSDTSDENVDEGTATTSLSDTSSSSDTSLTDSDTENSNVSSEENEENSNTSSDVNEDTEENNNVTEESTNSIEEETNSSNTSNETNNVTTSGSETSSSDDEIENNSTSDNETNSVEDETSATNENVATSSIDNEIEVTSEETSDESSDEEIAVAGEDDLTTVDDEDYYLSEYYSEETASNIWDLQTSTNQYVWVPIDEEELEKIYGVDSNGKYWGKLYSAYSTATNWIETSGIMSITSTSSYREPSVTTGLYTYDADATLSSYLNGSTRYELLTQELEESFYETIESIRKYGGFYIGRYETGNLSSTTAVVQKKNSSISEVSWYIMYEKCKGLAGENSNVTTSMIWGSLWDATLRWLYESEATNSSGTTLTTTLIWSNSTTWGNYYNATFDYYTAYNSTSTKSSSSKKMLSTGVAEYTKVNNIYDMAGNVWDWTLEAGSANGRVYRGGLYYNYGSNSPAGYRYYYNPTYSYSVLRLSCFSLY